MPLGDEPPPGGRETVVVFGALRSGTTLLKLLFDMHGGISNPGEFDFLADYLTQDSSGAWRLDRELLGADRIFLDRKLTLRDDLEGLELARDLLAQIEARSDAPITTINLHRNAWALNLLFPNARIIHVLRDPRDVGRSSIGMGWYGLAYFGVDHWIDTERGWDRNLANLSAERVFELKYEDLVRDPEQVLGAACRFMGQDYQPGMLNFHLKSSYDPIDAALAEQWRTKATQEELSHMEFKLGPLLAQKGYAASGAPSVRPGPMARRWLWLRNKQWTIRKSVQRYGLPLYIALKLRQALGLKTGMRGVLDRKLDIDRQHLR